MPARKTFFTKGVRGKVGDRRITTANIKFSDMGHVIGRYKTHQPGGQLFGGEFSREGGEGPLIKDRHRKQRDIKKAAGLQPVKPEMTKRVIQNKATVFTLTGGYYPTFTQAFNNMRTWYDNYQVGYNVVNESFNASGPAGITLRGNHTWYKYAPDYMDTVEKDIGLSASADSTGKTPNLQDNAISLIDEIFEKYKTFMSTSYGGVGATTEMMNTWREQVTKKIMDSAEPYLDEEDTDFLFGEQKKQQAPEELIPAILIKMYPELAKDLELAPELMETHGKAHSVDIVFKFLGQVYAKDVTQSRIMEGGTHTSIGTFKPSVDALAYSFQENPDTSYLAQDLLKHFKESRKTINLALKAFHEMFQHSGGSRKDKYGKSLREWLGTEGSPQYLKSRMSGADSQAVMKRNTDNSKVVAELSKREGIMDAVDAALHIIGMQWSSFEGEALDTGGSVGYSDLFVLSNEHPINVGVNWQLTKRARGKLWVISPISMEDIVINPASTFYMDHFIQTIEHQYNVNREVVLQIANMMWAASNLYMTGPEMIMGKVQEQAITTGAGGYLVAGGAVVFEPTEVNAAIGEFLEDVMDLENKGKNLSSELPQVEKALEAGKNAAEDFHDMIQTIPNPISYEQVQLAPDNFAAESFLGELTEMNNIIKASSWAAPYVGIYYQGGQKSGIWPVLSGD